MPVPEKRALLDAVRIELQAELSHLELATKAALHAATDEESRPENQYDTRALEASYLAAAQGKRVLEIKRMLGMLEVFPTNDMPGPIASGSLVEVEADGKKQWYFLLPFGAGLTAESRGVRATVVSLDSPMGQLLLGKKAGEMVELPRPGGTREIEILGAY